MTQVFVIGTRHEEKGLVTVAHLVRVLERIRPEVLFLELPPEDLAHFLNGTRENLESAPLTRYRENRDVVLVPVDLSEPDSAFFREPRFLVSHVERTSRKYCRLIDEKAARIEASGFAYLNSERSDDAWQAIDEELRDTVQWLAERQAVDHHRLRDAYDAWWTTNALREEAMLARIEDHARLQPFGVGVFLIGAAHRSKISGKRIARVIFVLHGGWMVLLHGFVKKSQKTPKSHEGKALGDIAYPNVPP